MRLLPHVPSIDWTAYSLDGYVGRDETGEPLTGHDVISASHCSQEFRARNLPGGLDGWCAGCGSPGGCLC